VGLIISHSLTKAKVKEFIPDLTRKNNTEFLDSAFCLTRQEDRIYFWKWEYPNSGPTRNVLPIIHGKNQKSLTPVS
jgi:hypothetical protein